MRLAVKIAVGLAVSALFVYALLAGLALERLGPAIAGTPWEGVTLGILALAAGYAIRVARWRLMLRHLGSGIPFGSAAQVFLASFALNNVAPLRAGDALRVFAASRQTGLTPSRLAGTLIVERAMDLICLAAFFFAGLALVGGGGVPVGAVYTGLIGTLALFAAVFVAPGPILRGLARLSRLPRVRRSGGIRRGLLLARRMLSAIRRLMDPALVWSAGAATVLAWAFEGAVFLAVLGSAAPSLFAPWFSMASGTLFTLLPGTPGHVGTFDFGAQWALVAEGAQRLEATAAVLVIHGVLWLPVTVAGLLCFAISYGGAWRAGGALR